MVTPDQRRQHRRIIPQMLVAVCEIETLAYHSRVEFTLKAASLPLVKSDLERRGFLNGKFDTKGVKVIITDFGPEQRRFIERLVEFTGGE